MKTERFDVAETECHDFATLVGLLAARSANFPDRCAFRFLDDRNEASTVSYHELDESARRIAASLQCQFEQGSSAALVFPPGIEFIKAFFGCVYAGVLPIPATYPKPRRPSARLTSIVGDARPAAMITTESAFRTHHGSQSSSDRDFQTWLSLAALESSSPLQWHRPSIDPDDVAFLQYTSGSTKDPRGVEVSHLNICNNLEMIRRGFGLASCLPNQPAEVGVSWLPAYHDMGLIGGILESIYVGGTTILMSPLSFLQRPARWLRAISDYQAVVSGGPNFAYELCLRKIKPEEIEDIDLSSWRVAFSGAEPIRARTLRRFAEQFSAQGFSESAFYPCYGLAEATLLVTGGHGPGNVSACRFQADELTNHGRAVVVESNEGDQEAVPEIEFVSCGGPIMDGEVVIVDPTTESPCPDNVVGEIWIRGSHVTKGYRNRPPSCKTTFHGRLAGSSNGHFLRSGDLGFMHEGSLFVTGRLKELLIIRGRNHYPHDLEATVQETSDKLIPGGGAAFLVDRDDHDLLILVQEVDRSTSPREQETIIRDIRRNVVGDHDVFVHEVILIRAGTLLRTTSGKVRYADVRKQYAENELCVVAQWSFQPTGESPAQDRPDAQADPSEMQQLLVLPPTDSHEALVDEIERRLMTWISRASEIEVQELDSNQPFADFGLDSLTAVELIGQLEMAMELQLSPTVAWTYPTPAALARHLASLVGRPESEPASESPQQEPADDEFDQLLSQLEQMPEDEVSGLLGSEDGAEERQ